MIVLDRPKLKFLLAGRAITVDVTRTYRKGRSYAVGTSHKRSVCRVQVLEIFELNDTTRRLTIKLSTEEKPRLLAANPAGMRSDYTNDPKRAAQGEPEALTDAQLQDLTKYRAAHAHGAQAAPLLDWRDRLVAELDEAMRSAPSRDTRDKLRAAKHHLTKIERAS